MRVRENNPSKDFAELTKHVGQKENKEVNSHELCKKTCNVVKKLFFSKGTIGVLLLLGSLIICANFIPSLHSFSLCKWAIHPICIKLGVVAIIYSICLTVVKIDQRRKKKDCSVGGMEYFYMKMRLLPLKRILWEFFLSKKTVFLISSIILLLFISNFVHFHGSFSHVINKLGLVNSIAKDTVYILLCINVFMIVPFVFGFEKLKESFHRKKTDSNKYNLS